METREQYPITLVTAYFELGGKPGWAENPYPGWIRNFLPFVRWPLVIFCDEQSLDMLKEARGDKPAVWHVTRPEEFYVYKYLGDLKRLSFPAGQAEVFIARSLIWHEKHHFLRQALSENPFGSEMLFWCDIGQFRYCHGAPWSWQTALWNFRLFRLYEDLEWPSLGSCRALPQDKVIVIRWVVGDSAIVSACFFGGAIEPSRLWCDAYFRHLEKRSRYGAFTHREELVMKGCWRRCPELVHILPHSFYLLKRHQVPDYTWHFLSGYRLPWKYLQMNYGWYFLKGGRFPWKYFFRRLSSGFVR